MATRDASGKFVKGSGKAKASGGGNVVPLRPKQDTVKLSGDVDAAMRPKQDVNAEFGAERERQVMAAEAAQADFRQRIEDGRLVPVGGGQFKVNDKGSWDNGEIWIEQNGIAVPQSGLDLREDGTANLYTAVPTWHHLEGAGLIPGGTKDIDEVMRLSGLDFEVEKRQSHFFDHEGNVVAAPGQFINTRTDTWATLGAVGNQYVPIQPREGFEFLLELTGSKEMLWESAGPMRGGRKVFVVVELPEDAVIDPDGIADHIKTFVAVINSYDGWSPFQAYVTPWRIICGNTERFAIRDAHYKWTVRHTKNAMDRVKEAQRTLNLSAKYYDRFAEEETVLARAKMSMKAFDEVMSDLWPLNDEPSKAAVTRDAKRKDALHGLYAVESERVGATAYAAERTVTDYLDHVAPKRAIGDSMAAARATAVLEGKDDGLKTKAHQRLMQTVKTR